MSEALFRQGPGLVNPDKLDTVEALRAELGRVNDLVTMLHGCVGDISASLAPVLIAHTAGNAARTVAALDDLIAKHVRLVSGPPAGGMH